jgi:hypothetical protein
VVSTATYNNYVDVTWQHPRVHHDFLLASVGERGKHCAAGDADAKEFGIVVLSGVSGEDHGALTARAFARRVS